MNEQQPSNAPSVTETVHIFSMRIGQYRLEFCRIKREGGIEALKNILDDWKKERDLKLKGKPVGGQF